MFHDLTIGDPIATFAETSERAGFYPRNNLASFLQDRDVLDSNRGSLPFRITLARTEQQLAKAVALRAMTFGRRSLDLARAAVVSILIDSICRTHFATFCFTQFVSSFTDRTVRSGTSEASLSVEIAFWTNM